MPEISLIAAFVAGLITFFSPCVLPLLPAYLGYLAGTSINETKTNQKRQQLKIFVNACLFILGFMTVFALLGLLVTTTLRHTSLELQTWLARIGGIIIILFGLSLVGIIKPKFFNRERSIKFNIKPSYIASFLFGAAFAAGWTPCIGPVLGSIFGLALAHPALSFGLLLTYALGFSIPLLIVGLFTAHASKWIKSAGPWFRHFEIIVGVVLIIMGLLMLFNMLSMLSNFGFLYKVFN